MGLTDIMPLEKWEQLEKEISRHSGLDVNVFNPDGYRITGFKFWANRLCPAIKDTDRGQSFICALAHMNISAMAKQSGKPVIEECDAGLMKLVVPIHIDDQFVGAVGACGHLLEEGEIDDFLINKITEISEEVITDLSSSVPSIKKEKAEQIAEYIKKQLEEVIP